MATPTDYWVIGDVQGCAQSLEQLLAHPELQAPHNHLVFVGDLVNRGPDSARVLRAVQQLGTRASTVLGNHDIHLLAVAAGAREAQRSDTLDAILQASDRDQLIDWLRHRPLALHVAGHLIIHAGLPPEWTLHHVLKRAKQVEKQLQADNWQQHIGELFGNKPFYWSDNLSTTEKNRYTINMLTRLRQFDATGKMDTKDKGAPRADSGLTPWFAMPERHITIPVAFGHWSTLGLYLQHNVIGIDTGCLWGGQLTAIRLRDKHIIQTPNTDCVLQPF